MESHLKFFQIAFYGLLSWSNNVCLTLNILYLYKTLCDCVYSRDILNKHDLNYREWVTKSVEIRE